MGTMEKQFLSTSEAAKLLGVSRIAVFKKIKSGEIRAEKIGRNFGIRREDLPHVLHQVLREDRKKEFEQAVRKTIQEYGQTLKLRAKE